MFDVAPEHTVALRAGALVLVAICLACCVRSWLTTRGGVRVQAILKTTDGIPLAAQIAAGCLLISGVVHLALVHGHLDDSGVTSALFVLDGICLVGLSLGPFLWQWWRRPAAYLLVANLVAYVMWTVAGWETPDQVGIAAKFIELIGLAMVLSLAPGRRYRWPRRIWRAARLSALTTVLTVGLWVGSVAHPDALHAHPGALQQATSPVASPSDQQAAALLREHTMASIARYHDPAAAVAAGFTGEPSAVDGGLVHYSNRANDGIVLDPDRPQALVYASTRHGLLLIGAMYQMPRFDTWGPDPGGPLTQWHRHEGICATVLGGLGLSFATPFWTCPVGSVSVTTPPMLHVWTIDNPDGGPFAADLDHNVIQHLEQS